MLPEYFRLFLGASENTLDYRRNPRVFFAHLHRGQNHRIERGNLKGSLQHPTALELQVMNSIEITFRKLVFPLQRQLNCPDYIALNSALLGTVELRCTSMFRMVLAVEGVRTHLLKIAILDPELNTELVSKFPALISIRLIPLE